MSKVYHFIFFDGFPYFFSVGPYSFSQNVGQWEKIKQFEHVYAYISLIFEHPLAQLNCQQIRKQELSNSFDYENKSHLLDIN